MFLAIQGWVIPVIILIIVVIVYLSTRVKIVSQSNAYVIERLGRFQTVWQTGLHFLRPVTYRIVKKVSLKEQVYYIGNPQLCKKN